jgi:hypothetical protein
MIVQGRTARRLDAGTAYVNALDFVAVLFPTCTVTSTVPAACAGANAVIVTASTTATFVAGTSLNFTDVTTALVKPAPLIVTVAPPFTEVEAGVTEVIEGGGTKYVNARAFVTLCPSAFVTVTSRG